jgi:hypothetical protein
MSVASHNVSSFVENRFRREVEVKFAASKYKVIVTGSGDLCLANKRPVSIDRT